MIWWPWLIAAFAAGGAVVFVTGFIWILSSQN